MEINRKVGIGGALFVMLFIIAVSADRWLNFAPPSAGERWGLLAGVGVGLLFCWYTALHWDPVRLESRRTRLDNPLVAVLGIVGSIALSEWVARRLPGFDYGLMVTGAIIWLSYLTVQVWRHRPRA